MRNGHQLCKSVQHLPTHVSGKNQLALSTRGRLAHWPEQYLHSLFGTRIVNLENSPRTVRCDFVVAGRKHRLVYPEIDSHVSRRNEVWPPAA